MDSFGCRAQYRCFVEVEGLEVGWGSRIQELSLRSKFFSEILQSRAIVYAYVLQSHAMAKRGDDTLEKFCRAMPCFRRSPPFPVICGLRV